MQFMKAGIAEIPHLVVVTKADMDQAGRARNDVLGALALAGSDESGGWTVPVLMVSAAAATGLDDLFAAIDRHHRHLAEGGRLAASRDVQARAWLEDAVRERFGREGMKRAGRLDLTPGASPFRRLAQVVESLR